MNITIDTYTIAELEDFVGSEEYKNMPIIPISSLRAKSYCNNPRALPDDEVLYIARIDNEMVGFRTLLPDTTAAGTHFAWMSGNWVRDDMRRKGISSVLLRRANEYWNSKYMYTNYAPASKLVYDKSTLFSMYSEHEGTRYYMRDFCSSVLPAKHNSFKKIFPLLRFADIFLNICLSTSKAPKSNTLQYESPATLSDEHINFILTVDKGNIIHRDKAYLQWMVDYPWIAETNRLPDREYPFSYLFRSCKRNIVAAYDKGTVVGIYILHVKAGIATLPFFFTSKKYASDLSNHISQTCHEQKVKFLTSYQPLFNMKSLLKKKQVRRYFISNNLKEVQFHEHTNYQDGDGDTAFV